MKEKVKELMKQAGTDTSGKWMSVDNAEKFAELIVRECAQIADDGFASSNFGNGITGHQLLKHFGVEE